MMSNQEFQHPLTGKVAQVLNERELVINIGRNQGVTIGMKFAVLTEKPLEIHDPDTHGLIGVVDRPKVKVRAVQVDENISICSTYVTTIVGVPNAYQSFAEMIGGMGRREIVETLRADDQAHPEALTPDESYVKIGDAVKEISG